MDRRILPPGRTRFSCLAAALAFALVAITPPAHATSDLIPSIGVRRPDVWGCTIVPRLGSNAAIGDSLLPAPQLGAGAPVWLNWLVSSNSAWSGYWTDALLLDNGLIEAIPRYNDAWANHDWYALNFGAIYVHPGRHTLTAWADYVGPSEDFDRRGDNVVNEQFLWAPAAVAPGAVSGNASAPPPAMFAASPNCDAYQLARTPGFAWTLALRPYAGTDTDLRLYDDYTDSQHGLSHEIARGAAGGDSLELLIGSPDAGPATLYAAAIRGSGTPGGYSFHLEDAQGRFHAGSDVVWGAETLTPGIDTRVYELDLDANVGVPISVWPRVGTSKLRFAIFRETPGAIQHLADALATSTPVAGQDYAVARFAPAETGRYAIVVIRDRDLDSPGTTRFELAIGAQAVAVGPAVSELALAAPAPNPVRSSARIAYTLPRAGHVRLSVYDTAGRRVREVVDADQPAGPHEESLALHDERDGALAPGLYLVRLESLGRVLTTRLVAIR